MMDLHCILCKCYLKIYLSIVIVRLKCESTNKELFKSVTIIHDHFTTEWSKGNPKKRRKIGAAEERKLQEILKESRDPCPAEEPHKKTLLGYCEKKGFW